MAPLGSPLARKRSILNNRAKIRAIDLLRVNPDAQLGEGTIARLRKANPGGFDPVGVLRGLARAGGAENQNLANVRHQALQGWKIQGQEEEGGNRAPEAPPATPNRKERRLDLLSRTGDNAISADLQTRILERIRRERARRG